MDDFLKLRCIELVKSSEYGYIDEWLEVFKWRLTCKILNNTFTSITQVYSALEEYGGLVSSNEILQDLN